MSRIWFVTGSGQGLGRAVVEAALAAGDSVVATAHKPEELRDLVDEYGDRVLPVALDVTDEADVLRAVQFGHERYGRLDVVVNNAGYSDTAVVEDVTVEGFLAQIHANFMGVVYVTKAVLPILQVQGGGHIIQVSFHGSRIGIPGWAAYQSGKWAVDGFSSVLTQEVAPLGIKVTVLESGWMRSDRARSSMVVSPIRLPYRQTAGQLAQMLLSRSGQEPFVPARVADIVVKVSEMPDPPLRLLAGPDEVDYAARAAEALAASDVQWRDLDISNTA